jgi:hypothetical protein
VRAPRHTAAAGRRGVQPAHALVASHRCRTCRFRLRGGRSGRPHRVRGHSRQQRETRCSERRARLPGRPQPLAAPSLAPRSQAQLHAAGRRGSARRLRPRRRLPDSKTILYGYYWVRVGSRLINPALGDGGEEYRWGRPHGGILDPERGVWSDLPNPPKTGPSSFGVGVLTRARGHYFGSHGRVLDTTRDRWSEIPRLEPERTQIGGQTVTSAGRKLLVFGGARFDRKTPRGRLLDAAWIWSPPRPAR